MKSCRGKMELVQQYSSMEIKPISQHTQTNRNNTALIRYGNPVKTQGRDFRNSVNHHSRRSQNCDKTLFD